MALVSSKHIYLHHVSDLASGNGYPMHKISSDVNISHYNELNLALWFGFVYML